MNLSLRNVVIPGVMILSLFAGSCCSLCDDPRMRIDQSVISVVPKDSGLTVYPYSAPAYRGMPVLWMSTYRIDRIEWLTPLDPERVSQPDWPRLSSLQCDEQRSSCRVDIPAKINRGYYPYYLYLTVDGREVKINAPELDIRGKNP